MKNEKSIYQSIYKPIINNHQRIMGVYDQFVGECPNCGKSIYFQTTLFSSPDDGRCFRDLSIGVKMPSKPPSEDILGSNYCCRAILKACFNGMRLDRYQVLSEHERKEYMEGMSLTESQKRYIDNLPAR